MALIAAPDRPQRRARLFHQAPAMGWLWWRYGGRARAQPHARRHHAAAACRDRADRVGAVAHPASLHQRVKRDDHHDQNADDDRKPSREQRHPPRHRHRPPPCKINPVAPRHHCFGSPSGCCGPSRRLSCWNSGGSNWAHREVRAWRAQGRVRRAKAKPQQARTRGLPLTQFPRAERDYTTSCSPP